MRCRPTQHSTHQSSARTHRWRRGGARGATAYASSSYHRGRRKRRRRAFSADRSAHSVDNVHMGRICIPAHRADEKRPALTPIARHHGSSHSILSSNNSRQAWHLQQGSRKLLGSFPCPYAYASLSFGMCRAAHLNPTHCTHAMCWPQHPSPGVPVLTCCDPKEDNPSKIE